jgi:hypothetical protein
MKLMQDMEHVKQKIGPARTWHHREEQDEDSGDHQGEFTINFVSSGMSQPAVGCLRLSLW